MKIIFSDFDGTLTNDGKLGAIFFDILELITKNKAELVIVSGRSLSWGHFLLTHFPFRYCIMEGGGVIVYRDESNQIKEENLVSDNLLEELEKLTTELSSEVKNVILSADSFGRRADRAIEFFSMDKESQVETERFLKSKGANFSKSDVHLNYWLGDLSKANAVSYFLKNYKNDIKESECMYFGDAPNDQSMFEYFEHTVGVSNIEKVLDQLKTKPKVILEGKSNIGAKGVFNYLKELF